MTPETAPDVAELFQAIGYILLALAWPFFVLWALRTLGASIEITPATYFAALVLVMSVKASKAR